MDGNERLAERSKTSVTALPHSMHSKNTTTYASRCIVSPAVLLIFSGRGREACTCCWAWAKRVAVSAVTAFGSGVLVVSMSHVVARKWWPS